jgi:uncharacterized membrane protein
MSEQNPATPPGDDSVWTFRGYRLKNSEFVTAMVHYYRAEIQRSNIWRQRLDTTTNWAVIATGAALSIAFSQPDVHHGVLILNTMLVTLFLYIEARRYRYYELWSVRTRLLETDFFGAMIVPPFHPSPEWAEGLAESLLTPKFPITMWEAFGRRLRRNYLPIFFILGLAWFAKYWLFPAPPSGWYEFISRAAVGPVPGSIVVALSLGYYAFLIGVAIFTAGLQQASGEVLPRFGASVESEEIAPDHGKAKTRPWFSLRKRRAQYLAYIITDKTEAVSKRILSDLKRGVTALSGTGMYTGKAHSVLMCAVTVTEINHLKSVVADEDQNAFVIVSPAQEVLGRGFKPLVEG